MLFVYIFISVDGIRIRNNDLLIYRYTAARVDYVIVKFSARWSVNFFFLLPEDFHPIYTYILPIVTKSEIKLTNSIIISRTRKSPYLWASINFLTKSDIIDRIIGLVNFHFGTWDRS